VSTRLERRHLHGHQTAWKARALGVLAGVVPLPRHPWGMSGLLDLVHVTAWDRAFPSSLFPGAAEVWITWPPSKPFPARAWSTRWNQAHGFPLLGPPWSWEHRPDLGVIVGRPFDLTGGPDGKLWLPPLEIDPRVLVLGVCEDGSPWTCDLDVYPHLLFAGGTGSGKTKGQQTAVHHLLVADCLQALVVLDWKRKAFTRLAGWAWDPHACQGVTVSKPDLSEAGLPVALASMLEAAEAVAAELGRRIVDSEGGPEGAGAYADKLVVLVMDEAMVTLQREPTPPRSDDSPRAEAIRLRNRQRDRIEEILVQVLTLGREYHVHGILGAQSPRKEFLPGEGLASIQWRAYMGAYLDTVEPNIIFGAGYPPSPPGWPGFGVWRVLRPDADPNNPYLYVKGFWLPDTALSEILAARILTAEAYEQARLFDGVSSPWLRDQAA
jgi:FtsK/SpoIIIE family